MVKQQPPLAAYRVRWELSESETIVTLFLARGLTDLAKQWSYYTESPGHPDHVEPITIEMIANDDVDGNELIHELVERR